MVFYKRQKLILSNEDDAKAVIRPLLEFVSKKHDQGYFVGDLATEDIYLIRTLPKWYF